MFGTWKRECLRYFQILSVSFQGCICCISYIWDEIYYPFMVGDDLIRSHFCMYKDPIMEPIRILWNVMSGFCFTLLGWSSSWGKLANVPYLFVQ